MWYPAGYTGAAVTPIPLAQDRVAVTVNSNDDKSMGHQMLFEVSGDTSAAE